MFEKLTKTLGRYQKNAHTWFETHGSKIFLSLGIFAAIALAFESGFLLGRDQRSDPLIIATPAASCAPASAIAGTGETGSEVVSNTNTNDTKETSPIKSQTAAVSPLQNAAIPNNESCAFVGSKNSDKYHLPKCSWAKRIKPENRVCFTSVQDAETKGYKAGCVK